MSPNSYLFSNNGDGIKNYYTYAYQIKNNTSSTNFEGFNYPYGEHFFYTDCHPILVSVLQPLHSVFPSISDYSIGILNFLMLFSLFVTAYILYLLLRALTIQNLLASLGAIAITILSPQLFRMQGHFALSYSFVVPLSLYLLLQYHRTLGNKWLILLFGFNLFGLLTHAYLGMLSILLTLAFVLTKAVMQGIQRQLRWKEYLGLLLSSLLPIFIFLTVTSLTDHHAHRTNNPYGFFAYYADFDTVFLPNHPPFQSFIFSLLPNFTQTWEGWSYIGLGTIFLLPFIGWHAVKQLFILKEKHFLPLVGAASLIILVFSTGIPFRLIWEESLEYFPVLKQFRSIGRFAWIFYFVISLYAIFYIDLLSRRIKNLYLRTTFVCLLPLLMIIEGIPYHKEVSKSISLQPNSFHLDQSSPEFRDLFQSIEVENYQAIIPLPFYCIGSENFEKEASNSTYFKSMLLSYHSALPLVSSYLSRTSINESKNSMQLFAPDFYQKDIQQNLSSQLPFLIYVEKSQSLTPYEEVLLAKSLLIRENELEAIFELKYDQLFNNTALEEVTLYQSNEWVSQGGFELQDSSTYFYYDSFENESQQASFRGNASLIINQQENNLIATLPANNLQKATTYIASIWLSRLSENAGQDDLNHLEWKVKELTPEGESVQESIMTVMESPIHLKDWTMIETSFKIQDHQNTLHFYLEGNSPTPHNSFVDDFFVTPQSKVVYQKMKHNDEVHLFKNNHVVKSAF